MGLPDRENEMSRRYLALIMRWVPVAMRYWNEWPDRPDCGHFFGGVYWYGQETAMPIATLALAASSPEFDAQLAGGTADELRQVGSKRRLATGEAERGNVSFVEDPVHDQLHLGG